jgi:putative two-component system response regulator
LVSERPVVLAVDDRLTNLELVQAYLAEVDCEVVTATSGNEALALIGQRPVDMVLLDVMMPELDGFEVCAQIKADPSTRLVPVVMVTALNNVSDRVHALETGADDFIAKPVDRIELVARVRSLIRLKSLYDRLDDSTRVVAALARAVEAKDSYTEMHTERVATSARELARTAGVPEGKLDDIFLGGLIHDIGKIGVPDSLLGKAGPLTTQEVAVMRSHVIVGEEIVGPLRSAAGVLPIIRHHHERWDGTGYPDRLAGEAIPLPARIVAVCDAFDAMVSDRPYRPSLGAERALEILRAGAGRQWDPEMVALFLATHLQPVA